ncbi:PREDICTED: N-alpha-acetyltransferase 60-like [Branchiostoma belcheri]|uniref:N-alpha-acetyltransferase 60 n=1 Tax=Branchiostoma belcheri TaxID=7741 RepID=A0A6P5AEE0_BRABE|nr:PREDICTED: N-alpha-acetyltransferase 60-like [Branchiostoma belcheri]
MSSVQPSTMVNDVQLRFLCPEDIHTVKKLCSDWFPIEYPDSWYEEITSNPKFFSLAATYHSNIIGLIVSEVKSRNKIHKEDRTVLASSYPDNTQVAYILSLGVVQEYRQHGIASLLLETLLSHLTTSERHNVKAVYLHVLTTNTTAIRFYEHRSFRRHNYLPYYYAIKGVPKDGFSYVLYINGGKPPWTFTDCISYMFAHLQHLQLCSLPQRLFRRLSTTVWGVVPLLYSPHRKTNGPCHTM